MKRLSFLVFLSCFSLIAFAQSSFLEVVVTDTLLIKADKFIYRVNASADIVLESDTVKKPTQTFYSIRQQLVKEKQKQALSLVERKVRNAGFTILPFTINELSTSGYANSYFQVLVNSTDSLAQLYLLLKDEKSVNCNVGFAASTKETTEQERLFRKIIALAKTKAKMLADLSGKKIGSILSLSESRTFNNVNNNLYNQNFIAEEGNSSTLIEDRKISSVYSISNTVTVKFTLL